MLSSVLIIDDDVEIRKMLSEALNDEGYSVETEAEKSEESPEVFTKIIIKYIVKGKKH